MSATFPFHGQNQNLGSGKPWPDLSSQMKTALIKLLSTLNHLSKKSTQREKRRGGHRELVPNRQRNQRHWTSTRWLSVFNVPQLASFAHSKLEPVKIESNGGGKGCTPSLSPCAENDKKNVHEEPYFRSLSVSNHPPSQACSEAHKVILNLPSP